MGLRVLRHAVAARPAPRTTPTRRSWWRASWTGEGASGQPWTAAELNEKVRGYAGPPMTWTTYRLTDDELAAIRARRRELYAAWKALPAGEMLELPFGIAD